MAPRFSEIVEEARLSARALLDYGDHFFNPTVRLGVTGLSRAGKTVFITALIHGLTRGGRFPVFEPFASGRIARARLAPQPDDAVPRFDYENHVRTLIEARRWPNSTVDISELRLVIDYQRQNGADRTLTLDIVDYPGEWLLDLPLLNKSYEAMVAREPRPVAGAATRAACGAMARASCDLERRGPRGRAGGADRGAAVHRLFARLPRRTFCHEPAAARPLPDAGQPRGLAGADLCAARFARRGHRARRLAVGDDVRRYEAYKDVVVRPFFRDHFARLDRQVVLVDALSAFNSGPEALHDLEAALAGILDCFRIGRSTFLTSLFRPRIDRILFAATKADHLHHSSHDRLEAVLRRTVAGAVARAEDTGAVIDVVALAAVRATREATVARGRDKLPSILGTPAPGEIAGGETFDGTTEVATFPGDLPADPEAAIRRRRRVSRTFQRQRRKERFPLSALPAAATGKPGYGRPDPASHPP